MADYQYSTTFAFDRGELCWPVLFHVEPLIAGYPWKAGLSVTVSTDLGPAEYPTVAAARAGSQDGPPPHRVELYASLQDIKTGVWVVGFGDGEQPAVTIYSEAGIAGESEELRESVAEFLGRNGVDVPSADPGAATAAPAPVAKRSVWRWMTNQPMAVQIIGGVIATFLASGIAAIIALIVR